MSGTVLSSLSSNATSLSPSSHQHYEYAQVNSLEILIYMSVKYQSGDVHGDVMEGIH